MEVGHLRQVVRPQRGGHHLDQQSRGGVEHGQQMRHRKAAAGALRTGLTEVLA